ncbi:hypothetical protein CTRI78_v002495 [Colletotrichum trifolii]|uniref:AB hydrolase-1 domain-containing protein n=1 Tax=Colletotrichum trifolii TaxID=5466 RepID=A0A4R8RQ52_COLTR|nr:hypothetical protein CTRI78_v002495 [Colletotrichum trifolii]
MVNIKSSAVQIAFASLAAARICQNLTVEVDITARNGVFNVSAPDTNVDVTNIMLGLAQQGNNYSSDHLEGYADVGGKYQLATTYCEPKSGPGGTIQILTHGIGFDRVYWDLPNNNYNYSYVGPAVSLGYSTLTWDRLGIAQSSRGEPVNEIQGFLELAALKALTDKVRAGAVGGRKFDKVVHVGHSFGSVHSYALTAAFPDISDGLILTGFSQNGSFLSDFLLGGAWIQANQVSALADYADGYLAPAYEGAVHVNFFAPDDFDPEILTVAYETGKPVTVGELLTIGGESASGNGFRKPVLIITGERDVPFCGGDCFATGDPELPSILDTSAQIFKNSSKFETYVVPGAGHGLAISYSNVNTTSKMLDFLAESGLGCN